MRVITKRPEPASLTQHRKRPHSDYGNYQEKDDLRHTLVAEQRGLCCYCMGRIRPERTLMKVEHWQCQAHYSGEQLNYRNLLAACLGGHGKPAQFQHCDTSKANKHLKWNPANSAHHIETRIRYELDGSIRSEEADFDCQLSTVLNLNLPVLRNNRKSPLNAIINWWDQERTRIGGPVSRDRFVRKREQFVGGDGVLTPYSQVTVWWLDQKLAGMAA